MVASSGRSRGAKKSGKKKSKRSQVAWWEDWRWLAGISVGLVSAAVVAAILFSGSSSEPLASDEMATQPTPNGEAGTSSPAATPSPAIDERPIAEWVLKAGGSVTVVDKTDAQFYVTRADQIPAESVQVQGVNLCDSKSFKDEDLAKLKDCSALEELLLDRTNITIAGLNSLGTQASLLRLSIEDCPLPEQAVTPIGQFKNLQMLSAQWYSLWQSSRISGEMWGSGPILFGTLFAHLRSSSRHPFSFMEKDRDGEEESGKRSGQSE